MPSPFPGMDPWLEAPDLFPDLHASLIYLIREALNATMPPGYNAIGNYLVWKDDTERRVPDVSLFGKQPRPTTIGAVATLPGLLAVGIDPAAEPRKQPYLEIRADRGQRLVTAVEILSPSNKVRRSNGRKAYRKKQSEFRDAEVNLVEFDFLRGGTHTTAIPLTRLRQAVGKFDYHISVVVAGKYDMLHAAPIQLADRLPTIGIPLDPGVSPVTLNLQPLLDRAYDTGRYPSFVRYDQPPDPPLNPEQAEWATGVLKAKGQLTRPTEA